MKKISFLLLFNLFLSSCSNEFLELYPKASLSEGSFYKSEVDYTLLVNGCYVPMRNYEKNWHWILAELPSDNATFQNNIRTGEAIRGVIDQFLQASGNQAYANFWNLSYDGITRCNKLLYELGRAQITWSDEQLKERSAGEALFLRALYYFNLVRQFGGVPLVTTPITSQEAVDIKRAPEDAVYENIVDDLRLAIEHFNQAKGIKENGRANEGAARALLGKVHLTRHQYAEAAPVLEAVISSGDYQLLPDYSALFNPSEKDYKETIFAIQFSENSPELANRFIFMFAPHTSGGAVTNRPLINIVSAGWNYPTDDLIDAFEEGDVRKEASIAYWTGEDWDNQVRPIPYCFKYKPPVNAPNDRCGDNFPILRYSDVLLMYAEVLNESGRTAEAIPFVQQVRNRAGLTAPVPATDPETLRAAIQKERQVEFCFENQRWYDLKRTGKAIEVLTAHGVREKAKKSFLYPEAYQLNPTKLLAPIPANEILINKLEQNPGY